MATRYLPELVYSLALSSISVHLLWSRRDAASDAQKLSARISILEDLAARLRAGEIVSDAEVARLRRLAREGEGSVDNIGEEDRAIGWKEVLFGRKVGKAEGERRDEWEQRDWERAHRELKGEASTPSSS